MTIEEDSVMVDIVETQTAQYWSVVGVDNKLSRTDLS